MEARTRIIVREEIAEIVRPMEENTRIFREEMRLLRTDSNGHERRITRLEAKTA